MKTHKKHMLNSFINKCWYAFSVCFVLWFLLLCFHDSDLFADNQGITKCSNYANSLIFGESSPRRGFAENSNENSSPVTTTDLDSCSGRYIYVHDLPSKFNYDIFINCSAKQKWYISCQSLLNKGLGPQAANSDGVLQNKSWFVTNQYMLEVIFHNRMKQYKCLTNDSSLASAIYVPFYAGLDLGRYLSDSNATMKDSTALDLVKWVVEKPEWKYMWGRDHFFVAGRVTWDFRRPINNDSAAGNKLMLLPEANNMTTLITESIPMSKSDFSIPYPTSFHPSSDNEVFQWQNKLRRQPRPYLFSFVGGPRPNQSSIRAEIINQCLASRRKCRFLDCNASDCNDPVRVMNVFQSSTFCLEPPGDTFARRSTFDSILAGCIPVFFSPRTAYLQYIWYLPNNYSKYSVFLHENEIKDETNIEKSLLKIPKEEVLAKREEVIKLIPKIIYADPRSSLENIEDAFDIAVKGVLERVERIRRESKEGSSDFHFEDEYSYKFNHFGRVNEHEWDFLISNWSRVT